MANKILIPTPLRAYAGKQDIVEAEGGTFQLQAPSDGVQRSLNVLGCWNIFRE